MSERPDFRRFVGHCRAIYLELQRGPRTNRQLSAISLKYTSRISDLRAKGVAIECRDLGGGLTEYRLGAAASAETPRHGSPANPAIPSGSGVSGIAPGGVAAPSSQQHELFTPRALRNW